MSFPFPKLLAFLEQEKDQVEFMKVASEVGLGSGDIELAKLLVALQLYKAVYATIPREIKTVHADALLEMRGLQEEVAALADRAAADAARIAQKADVIQLALKSVEPSEVAKQLHKRLLDDTTKVLGGSLQTLKVAYGQIDVASQNLNVAAYRAATVVQEWQTVALRQIWASAFCVCLPAAFLLLTAVWFVCLRHQDWWISLQ
jgi:hypothetical protein